jgi:hypothetical protein
MPLAPTAALRRLSRVAFACVIASALTPSTPASAQDGQPYARQRMGAHDWRQRGDGFGYGGRGDFGYGGFYNPYFYSGPIVTGSYYQRPYPYHFDYYRHRWGANDAHHNHSGPPAAAVDCPCADLPPVEAEVQPQIFGPVAAPAL